MSGGGFEPRSGRFRGNSSGPVRAAAVAMVISPLLFASAAAAASPPAAETDRQEGRSRLGPLWMSDQARARVRSLRAENATIHTAHTARGRDPDASLRKALAEFEHQTFPEESAPQLRRTIVEQPPEAWMRELVLPDLPVRWSEKTIEYLRYFKDDPQGQALMRAWLARKGRYEREIGRIFDEVGVPRDLVFVALVESGFRPDNTNSLTGAAGMWQFMEPTGRVYGLMSDYWFDDRYDYVKATYAAAAYFKDLHVRFGSWEMALAAYNAGYGLLMQTIRRNNTNNYWALCEIESGLPHQTTNYVPKLVAAAIVDHNRAAFGLDGIESRAPAELVEVKVPAAVRLDDLAQQLEFDAELLAEFNAGLRRGRTPPKGGPFTIRVPRQKLAKFEQLAPKLRAEAQTHTTHTLLLGEDLASVARTYGVAEKHLRELNGVRDSAEVADAVVLVVPRPSAEPTPGPVPPPPIAAVPMLEVPAGKRVAFLRTTRATTPQRISAALGLRWNDVVAWNDLDPQARLHEDLVLQLLLPTEFDARAAGVRVYEREQVLYVARGSQAHLDAMLAERDLVRRGYRVRKGDTLKSIAKRFETTVGSLGRINGFERSHPPNPGEILVVYVEKGETKGTVAAPPPKASGLASELAALNDGEGVPGSRRPPSTPETARVPGTRAGQGKSSK